MNKDKDFFGKYKNFYLLAHKLNKNYENKDIDIRLYSLEIENEKMKAEIILLKELIKKLNKDQIKYDFEELKRKIKEELREEIIDDIDFIRVENEKEIELTKIRI